MMDDFVRPKRREKRSVTCIALPLDRRGAVSYIANSTENADASTPGGGLIHWWPGGRANGRLFW
jgi:hypothetical protein